MKVPVAFHFWTAEGVSQWRPTKFPIPEIEKKVKDDYAFLQYEKPPVRRYGSRIALLEYEASSDIFHRETVAVRFAFIKESEASSALEKAVRQALREASVNVSFIRVYPGIHDLKKRALEASFGGKKLWAPGVVALGAVLIAIIFSAVSKDYSSASRKLVAPASPGKPVARSEIPAKKEPLFAACRALEEDDLLSRCPRSYLKLACAGESLPTYADWRKTSRDCAQARRNKFVPRADVFLREPSGKLGEEVLKILFP